MAFAHKSASWPLSGANKTSGANTTTTTLPAALSVGDFVLAMIAKDNSGTTDGDNGEITSVTDTKSNTYTKLAEFTNGQGSASTGATISVWGSILTVATTTSDTITFNFSSITAKAYVIDAYTVAAGKSVQTSATPLTLANDNADPGSMAISGLASLARLYVRATAYEAAQVTSTVTTNFTKIADTGTSAGGAATNMSFFGEYRINTSTGETSDPTVASADCASVFMALEEFTPPGVASAAGVGAASGTGFSIAAATASASGVGGSLVVGSTGATSATAAAAGTGASSVTGVAIDASVASSSGAGAVSGVGRNITNSIASAAGVGVTSGIGFSQAAATAAATGTGTASAVGGAFQRNAPSSDVSAGAWTPSTGVSLFAVVDEAVADDSDYISTTSASVASLGLPTMTDPGTDNDFTIYYRAKSDGSRNLTVRLKQGATLIASETRTGVPSTFTTYAFALSPTDVANITSFSTLRVEVEV